MAHNDRSRRNRDGPVAVRTVCEDPDTVIAAILHGIAALENKPVSALEPLYDRIDPDALVALLEHARSSPGPVGVEFTVEGYTVAVSDDGTVCIHDGVSTLASVGSSRSTS